MMIAGYFVGMLFGAMWGYTLALIVAVYFGAYCLGDYRKGFGDYTTLILWSSCAIGSILGFVCVWFWNRGKSESD